MNSFKKIVTVLIGIVMIAACNNSKSNKEVPKDSVQADKAVENDDPDYLAGKQLFTQNCMPCHQKDGMGVSGMNPPLSRTSYVLGDKKQLIGIVLNGLSGGIEINGETYSNSMGSFTMLKDKEIALILSYVRSSFGNDAGPVSEQEVSAVRASNPAK